MRFARVVETSAVVAATRSRTAKTAALRELLASAGGEVPIVVAWLSGEIRQGRLGIGWRTVRELQVAPRAEAILTVSDVDATFDRLATTSGAGSAATRAELLRSLLGRATVDEQNFLVRLLTGELRQGALSGVMVEAIIAVCGQPAPLVRRAHMLTGSLPETAVLALDGGRAALAAIGLQVGRPVSPMLATPAEDLAAALESLGPDVVVDHKLDGARIQVHRDGDDVGVFTRTLNDVTARVPDLVAVVRELPVRSVILDGETLTLFDDGRPRPFQDTMSRFGSMVNGDPGVGDAPALLRPFFFDCLHLDGEDLIDRPLAQRLDALDSIAPQLRISSVRHPTGQQAHDTLDAALAAGHEGIMVKSLSAPYAAGRRGKAWQKVKPVHTLDLLVLAAEWGSGRRTGYLSNVHLGARDRQSGAPVMVGKTFKGLTDALLRWQTVEFPEHEDHRDAHTVYLRPEIVVEIEFDGVQRSSRYPGGVALRFARVRRYRPDKSAAMADTIDAVRALLR